LSHRPAHRWLGDRAGQSIAVSVAVQAGSQRGQHVLDPVTGPDGAGTGTLTGTGMGGQPKLTISPAGMTSAPSRGQLDHQTG